MGITLTGNFSSTKLQKMISTLRILSRGNVCVLTQSAAPLSTSSNFNKSAPPPPTEQIPIAEQPVSKQQPIKLSFDYKDALKWANLGFWDPPSRATTALGYPVSPTGSSQEK